MLFMVLNRRGQRDELYGVVVMIIIILLIFSVIFVYTRSTGLSGSDFENLPEAAQSVMDTLYVVLVPIVNGLYKIVAPAGEPENVKAIAFSLFLLMTLVGQRAMRIIFRGTFISFFIAAIIGVIASRSLTETILRETALSAGPLATGAILVSFLPIFILTKTINRFSRSGLVRLTLYTCMGIALWIIIAVAYKSPALGFVYGIASVAMGGFELLGPVLATKYAWAKNVEVGRVMGELHLDLESAKAIVEGRAAHPSGRYSPW